MFKRMGYSAEVIGAMTPHELIETAETHLASAVKTIGTPQSGDHAAVATAFAALAQAKK